MRSEGVEALKAAVRRSLPLLGVLVVLGVIAVNAFQLIQGPSYEASARVLISPTPLSNVITGTEPSFVDPQRVQQTALGIADSERVYELAAKQTDESFGDAGTLRSSTEVIGDPDSDLISFTATSSDRGRAVGMVNAVGEAYVDFRAEVSGARITSTIERLQSRLSRLSPDSSEHSELQSELTKLEVMENLNSSDAELVQRATSASQTSPAPLRDSLIGLSIGLVVGLLVVALREAIDTRVRSEADVEDLLSTPVLATVRSLPRRTRIVTYGRHEAMFADTYALLAAQIVRDNPGLDGAVLAVTSAVSQEGKTTTAANLSVSVARRGTDVVLADFDFRKPALSELFGVPSSAKGALQVMGETEPLESTLWSVSLEGSHPRVSKDGSMPEGVLAQEGGYHSGQSAGSLYLLPSGGEIPTRNVPQRSRLGELIRQLKGRADFVILDTPPALLTVEVAELSRLIETILVVVRQGRASQRNLRTLRQQVRTWPAELAGAVMTDAPQEGYRYYYGGS